jgi:2-oxoglutarate dehydrogenase E2 component (dihydrolipoamide succinyltransferase)
MPTPVTLPALGESVTEGTVTRWLKQVGDEVAMDEPLLEVSTDKVDTEIPSPVAGTLLEVKVNEDETVEVGAELAVIGEAGDSAGDGSGDTGTAQQAEQQGEQQQGEAPGQQAEQQRQQPEQAEQGEQAEQQQQPAAQETTSEAPPTEEQQSQEQPTQEQPTQEQQPAAAEQPATGGTQEQQQPAAQPEPSGQQSQGEGTPVTLPQLGESVTEGTVTQWLKQVGDEVAVDEPLLEISTDKVDTEIPSPVAGTLLEVKVNEDETVEVGATLAVIGSGQAAPTQPEQPEQREQPAEEPAQQETQEQPQPPQQQPEQQAEEEREEQPEQQDEQQPTADQEEGGDEQPQAAATTPAPAPAPAPTSEPPQPSPQEEQQQPREQEAPDEETGPEPTPAPSTTSAGTAGDGQYVTPLVRKMAAEHGVDLASLTGSGVGGRIRKQDVLDAAKAQQAEKAAPAEPAKPAEEPAAAQQPAAQAAPSPLRGKTEPMSRLRKVIAKRMVESLQTSAQLTTVMEVDVTTISRLRDSVKADFASREGVKLSFLPFFAKAAIDALKQHPSLNAAIDTEKGEVTYFDHENLAVAVDTERGLLTPVIKDAGDLSVAGLARKIADVAERTRNNKIGPDELAGGTFTLTNTGSRGALFDTPIINQPQVAILGTGAVVKRPVVIDDEDLGETIAVRQMAYLALTYDHRLVDGADAARFLADVKQRLENGKFEV